jgi:hypothetical protein
MRNEDVMQLFDAVAGRRDYRNQGVKPELKGAEQAPDLMRSE